MISECHARDIASTIGYERECLMGLDIAIVQVNIHVDAEITLS